jgi:predicted GNAT superfamily acetyltransferase
MTRKDDIHVRSLQTYKEMLETEDLHRRVWKYPEPTNAKLLLTVKETGGYVVGAYLKGELVGFSYALLAKDDKGLYLRSQSLVVLKEFRDRGIGLLLRRAQRNYTLGLGMKRMEWTFDPLQTRLGSFYIKKLGAIVKRYHPHLYERPEMKSLKRVTSDRFYAEWYLDSPRVVSRLEHLSSSRQKKEAKISEEILVNRVSFTKDAPEIIDYCLNMDSVELLVEIPGNIEDILPFPDIRQQWRSSTQKIFDTYINQKKYTVVDFIGLENKGKRRNFYLLSKKPEENLPA